MAETGSDTRSAGIGVRLRAGREKAGLTLLQVAEKLHVDAKVVESLESERFEVLGAPVFVRGHLRHYAELIGEQPAQLLELYTGAAKAAMPDLTRLPRVAPAGRPSRLAVPALVVLIGFVLLGVVWWLVQSIGGSSGNTKPKSAGQPVTIEPEVAVEPTPTPTALVATPVAPASTPPKISPPPKTLVAVAPPPNNATSSTNASGAATPAPASVRGKPMEVTLKFAADSWVEIYDANGEKLFYDIGAADSSRTVSGTPPFRVTFGNAPGVTLDVNGKPATVPAAVVKDEAAQFTINRAGRIVRSRPQADGG
jgi:cytoskeleton protein RodZ